MTVGEHDDLWKRGARSIGNLDVYAKELAAAINRQTALHITELIYKEGEMSKDNYIKTLVNMLDDCGYKVNK